MPCFDGVRVFVVIDLHRFLYELPLRTSRFSERNLPPCEFAPERLFHAAVAYRTAQSPTSVWLVR